MTETLVRVVAPHFVAGLVLVGDICTEAAPIMRKWALGRSADQLRETIRQRGWTATIVRNTSCYEKGERANGYPGSSRALVRRMSIANSLYG